MMPRKTDKLKPSRVQQVPTGSLQTNITTSKLPGKLYHRWTWFEFWATQSWILHSATEVFLWTSRTCVPTAWHRGGQAHLCASHTWWTESLVPTCSNYKSLFTYHWIYRTCIFLQCACGIATNALQKRGNTAPNPLLEFIVLLETIALKSRIWTPRCATKYTGLYQCGLQITIREYGWAGFSLSMPWQWILKLLRVQNTRGS